MLTDFRGRVRERETSISCLGYESLTGLNPQPSHLPWPGIKPLTFLFTGRCSNQLSHTGQGHIYSLHFFHLSMSLHLSKPPFTSFQIKIFLHFWKKPSLVLCYYSFNKMLDVIWQWFIQGFYIYIHKWDWSAIFIFSFAKWMGKGSRFSHALTQFISYKNNLFLIRYKLCQEQPHVDASLPLFVLPFPSP